MSQIYYFSPDGKRYGPVTEQEAQVWYANGFFSSEIVFQVTVVDRADLNGSQFSLGELIDLNGKILPFYFSRDETSRQTEQERKLQQLMQEVESLRASYQESSRRERSEKEIVAVLQSQVTSLVESHTDLLRQLSELSNQKENSPAAPQLEKRVSELKKRVDEHEKNCASMRKELSAVTSKCDRNDTKLDRLLESQKKVESTVTGYDKRIGDLKTSEKSIRESLTTCEQNASSSVDQLKSISSELSEIKKEIEKEKELSTSHESELSKSRKDLEDAWEMIREHSDKLEDAEKRERSMMNEIKAVKETGEKTIQIQSAVPQAASSSDVPPWEREDKKAAVDSVEKKIEVKKDQSSPWAETAVGSEDKKEEESSPWESEQTQVAAEPTKAAGDAGVKKERAPWDEDEDDAAVPKKERAPWDDEESQPEVEPWNRTSGSGKTDSLGAMHDAPAKVEKATAAVKPVSRAKDWNAICRELSDDDEEGTTGSETPQQSLQFSQNFSSDFNETLKRYCAAMETGNFAMLKTDPLPLAKMIQFQATVDQNYYGYKTICDAVKDELRRLAAHPVYCSVCEFVLMTPYHIYHHFTHSMHTDCRAGGLAAYADDFGRLNSLIGVVFYKFVASPDQQQAWIRAECELVVRGRALLESQPDVRRLRPTVDFMDKIVRQMTDFAPTLTIAGVPTEVLARADVAGRKRELARQMRAWLECKKRQRQLQADFDAHFADEASGCAECCVAFVSFDEYCRHVTSYEHALTDQQQFFSMCIWAWKGNEPWDATM